VACRRLFIVSINPPIRRASKCTLLTRRHLLRPTCHHRSRPKLIIHINNTLHTDFLNCTSLFYKSFTKLSRQCCSSRRLLVSTSATHPIFNCKHRQNPVAKRRHCLEQKQTRHLCPHLKTTLRNSTGYGSTCLQQFTTRVTLRLYILI
jgi:hypothetical protein